MSVNFVTVQQSKLKQSLMESQQKSSKSNVVGVALSGKNKNSLSGGKRAGIQLRIIREHWFGGKCMFNGCQEIDGLELCHTRKTKLTIAKPTHRSSWERLKEVKEHPEWFILLCFEHHCLYDGKTVPERMSELFKFDYDE